MSATRMPHGSFGGITVVAYPDMGAQVLQLVAGDDVVAIPDKLEDHEVLRMRQHEGALLLERRVERAVEQIGVLVDELVLCGIPGQRSKMMLRDERFQLGRKGTHEILHHFRRRDLKAELPIIAHRDLAPLVHAEARGDEAGLHLISRRRVEVRDLQDVILLQDPCGDAELPCIKPCCGDASPFSVAAVLHLPQRGEEVLSLELFRARRTDDPAAALVLAPLRGSALREKSPGRGEGVHRRYTSRSFLPRSSCTLLSPREASSSRSCAAHEE